MFRCADILNVVNTQLVINMFIFFVANLVFYFRKMMKIVKWNQMNEQMMSI